MEQRDVFRRWYVIADDNPVFYPANADPNDPPHRRAFCTNNDVDWYTFEATAGDTFVIETSIPNPDQIGSIADPTLTLYRQDPHGFTLLAYDDNSGQNLGARIVYTAPAGGEIFVAVRSRDGGPLVRHQQRVLDRLPDLSRWCRRHRLASA